MNFLTLYFVTVIIWTVTIVLYIMYTPNQTLHL